VKYQALMEAQQRYRGIPPHCRIVLVLGGELPKKLLPLKHLLGIEVIEGIGKPIKRGFRGVLPSWSSVAMSFSRPRGDGALPLLQINVWGYIQALGIRTVRTANIPSAVITSAGL
jgi:hypothetical protein